MADLVIFRTLMPRYLYERLSHSPRFMLGFADRRVLDALDEMERQGVHHETYIRKVKEMEEDSLPVGEAATVAEVLLRTDAVGEVMYRILGGLLLDA